jgi:hypothetical protein
MKQEMKAAGIFAKAGEKKLAAHERREAMGKEKDTPAIAKKEMSVLKKSKAPKDVMKYEKAEHKSMGFARGGGMESKGKTRGAMVKMARGGGVESKGKTKVKRFAEGGDFEDDTDAEGYGTKITRSPRTFAEAFKEARKKGAGTEFTWNGKKIAAYKAGEEPESWKKPAPKAEDKDLSEVAVSAKKLPIADSPMSSGPTSRKALGRDTKYDKFVDAMAPGFKEKPRADEPAPKFTAQKVDVRNMFPRSASDRLGGGMKSGGSVKKFARGGGIESKGKTRGRYI